MPVLEWTFKESAEWGLAYASSHGESATYHNVLIKQLQTPPRTLKVEALLHILRHRTCGTQVHQVPLRWQIGSFHLHELLSSFSHCFNFFGFWVQVKSFYACHDLAELQVITDFEQGTL